MTDGGEKQDVGFSVDLTLDARAQALAQQVAACYTGAQAICQALRIARDEDGAGKEGKPQPIGHNLLENAMVRMAGIAIIDIDSGRIEAVAGALSPAPGKTTTVPAATRSSAMIACRGNRLSGPTRSKIRRSFSTPCRLPPSSRSWRRRF